MHNTLTRLALVGGMLAITTLGADAHDHGGETSIDALLEADYRDDDRARDQYRNPAETLEFFGIKPNMVLGEYGPGGGWYTRILAPMVAKKGTYVGINADVETYNAGQDAERNAQRKLFPTTFPAKVTEWTGLSGDNISAVEVDEAPDWAGMRDAIVTFRGLHGLTRKNLADETLKHFYGLLKPGGIVGVVQHRAKEDAPYDYARGFRGYLKQSEVIATFERQGFELVKTAEINANPADEANWEKGVWTLPPTLTNGDTDREKYMAIGETDRMTMLFKKP